MAETQLEGLSFQMKANADKASKGVKALTQSLEQLRTATQALKQFTMAAESLNKASTASQKNMTEMAKALHKLANTKISSQISWHIRGIGNAAKNIPEEGITKLERLADAVSKLKSAGVVGKNGISMPNTTGTTGQTQQPTDAGSTTDVPAPTVEQSFGRANGRFFDFLTNIQRGSPIAASALRGVERAGHLVEKGMGKLASVGIGAMKGLGKGMVAPFKGAFNAIGNIFNQVRRVIFYRMIRSMLKMLTDGLKTGMNNLYGWAVGQGNAVASRLDSIATSAQYVKNSFAAMVSPLIGPLSSALDFIADKVVTVMNIINQFFARLTGQSTYIAAKKVQAAYSDAASGTAGAVKNAADKIKSYTNGIDELNIFEKPQDTSSGGGAGTSGGGTSAGSMFETRAIEGEVLDFADKLKKLFEAGDWDGLGQALGTKFNEIFADDTIWNDTGKTIGEKISAVAETASSFFKTANFTKVGEDVASFVNGALETTNTWAIGSAIAGAVTSAIDTVAGFWTALDKELLGNKIRDFIVGGIKSITDWVNSKNWEGAGDSVVGGIGDLVKGLTSADDKGNTIGNAVIDLLSACIKAAFKAGHSIVIPLTNDMFDVNLSTDSSPTDIIDQLIAKPARADFDLWWTDFETNWITPLKTGFEKISEFGSDIGGKIAEGIETAFTGLFNGTWVKKFIIDPIGISLMGEEKWKEYAPKLPVIGNLYKTEEDDKLKTPSIDSNANLTEQTDKIPLKDKFIGGVKAFFGLNGGTEKGFSNEIGGMNAKFSTNGGTQTGFTKDIGGMKAVFGSSDGGASLKPADKAISAVAKFVSTGLGGITKNGKDNGYVHIDSAADFVDTNKAGITGNGKDKGYVRFKSGADFVDTSKSAITANGKNNGYVHFKSTAVFKSKDTTTIQDKDGKIRINVVAYVKAMENTSKHNENYKPEGGATGGIFGGHGYKRPVQQYAGGGLPSFGQLFLAREAGPELVGSIGRNTVVMNNNQIVSSVAAGVASAVTSVLSKIRTGGITSARLEMDTSAMANVMSMQTSEDAYRGMKRALDEWYEEKLRSRMDTIAEADVETARNTGKRQTVSVRDITAEQKRQEKANGYAFA